MQCKKLEGAGHEANGNHPSTFRAVNWTISSPRPNRVSICSSCLLFHAKNAGLFPPVSCGTSWIWTARRRHSRDSRRRVRPGRLRTGLRTTWLDFGWAMNAQSLIEKAKGNHSGRRPRFVVSITIRKGHESG